MLSIESFSLGSSILDDLPSSLAEALIRHMPGGCYTENSDKALEIYINLLCSCCRTKMSFDKMLLIHAIKTEFTDIRNDARNDKISKQEAADRLEAIVRALDAFPADEKIETLKVKLKVMIWRL